MKQKILKTFPAFSARDFRLYFSGQFISMSGTFLQSTAQGWLVYQLTGSATEIGSVAAYMFLPSFVLGLFGGVITDRFADKRILLYGTQISSMLLALTLAALTFLGIVTVPEIKILAMLLGIINAVDVPARMAIVSDLLTDKSHMKSAVSLNSGMTNLSQVVGPGIAGPLVAAVGVAWAFVFNGLTFGVVIFVLMLLHFPKPKPVERDPNKHVFHDIWDGIVHSFRDKEIRFMLCITGFVALFGRTFSTILPVTARLVYHDGAKVYGYLLAAFGAGAFLGMFALSTKSNTISSRMQIILGTIFLGFSCCAFGFASTLWIGIAFLVIAGFSWIFVFSSITTTLQSEVPADIKGRVISIMLFVFYGFFTLGNYLVGKLTDVFGPAHVTSLWGAIVFVGGLFLLLSFLKKLYLSK
ncbi:MAG: major facilitator superfamily 1 [Patescibacteria group bacterium]|nr:major facilitator superfamily 1 [Patescibacteria group bacterium]